MKWTYKICITPAGVTDFLNTLSYESAKAAKIIEEHGQNRNWIVFYPEFV